MLLEDGEQVRRDVDGLAHLVRGRVSGRGRGRIRVRVRVRVRGRGRGRGRVGVRDRG